jgi:hypothetical protein
VGKGLAAFLVLVGSLSSTAEAKAIEPFIKIIAQEMGFETYVYKGRLISGQYLLDQYAATFCYVGTFADVQEIVEGMVKVHNSRKARTQHSTSVIIERLEAKSNPTYADWAKEWIELDLNESTVNLITGGSFDAKTSHRAFRCTGI